MPDHLHPSEEGYHTIIKQLKPFLKQFDPPGSEALESADGVVDKRQNGVGDSSIYGQSKAEYGVATSLPEQSAKAAYDAVAKALYPSPVSPTDAALDAVAAARERNAIKSEQTKPLVDAVRNFASSPIIPKALGQTTIPISTPPVIPKSIPDPAKKMAALNPPNHTQVQLEPPRTREMILEELRKKQADLSN